MAEVKDIVLHGGPAAGKTYGVASMVKVVTLNDALYVKTDEAQTIKGRKFEVFQFKENPSAEESAVPAPQPPVPARRRPARKQARV